MRTAVSRLKGDVAKLGGPSDTVELRKSVSEAMSKTQDDAQEIKQQLMGVAPEKKNRQTAKILSDFEVDILPSCRCPLLQTGCYVPCCLCAIFLCTIFPLARNCIHPQGIGLTILDLLPSSSKPNIPLEIFGKGHCFPASKCCYSWASFGFADLPYPSFLDCPQ